MLMSSHPCHGGGGWEEDGVGMMNIDLVSLSCFHCCSGWEEGWARGL